MFTENLTIKSSDFSGKLTIFAEESQRYLCFNKRWKLVGMTPLQKDEHKLSCQFYEESLENGYSRFRSARRHAKGVNPEDPSEFRYIGINKRGKPMKETRSRRLKPNMLKCLEFLKLPPKNSVDDHNKKKTGQNADITSILSNKKINLAPPSLVPSSISSSIHNNLHAPYVYTNRMSNKAKIRHKFHHRQNFNTIT
ncbi:hypothetical protein V9T40_011595 [Parthenolecanium corni]|uniref:Fibroblast growth factor n=1 Tax=Parthenolecanium corni TaxID=536013 RepID=A0AAN9T977_9HEMI